MKTLMALMVGISLLASGSAFAAGGKKHHPPESKERPKARAQGLKNKSANEQRALKSGTKRQDLKELNRQQRAKKGGKKG